MFVRLLDNLWVNPTNIPLRRFAFATRRCPPSKGDVGLAKAVGGGVVFRPHRHLPASQKRSQNPNQGVILNSFQDLIRVVAIAGRFRNKFRMTQECLEIVSS